MLASVVPDTGGDHAARPSDTSHLEQPGHRILHEMNDELGERRVETIHLERQILGGSPPRSPMPG